MYSTYIVQKIKRVSAYSRIVRGTYDICKNRMDSKLMVQIHI